MTTDAELLAALHHQRNRLDPFAAGNNTDAAIAAWKACTAEIIQLTGRLAAAGELRTPYVEAVEPPERDDDRHTHTRGRSDYRPHRVIRDELGYESVNGGRSWAWAGEAS